LSGIETVRLAEYLDNNASGVLVLQDKQKNVRRADYLMKRKGLKIDLDTLLSDNKNANR
jgi:hypothetical protein